MSGLLITLNFNKDLELNKQLLGQFYTTTDPFNCSQAFKDWYKMVPKDVKFLEPFAGGGHLFNYISADWDGYDIRPNHPNVVNRNTIEDFPRGYKVCITNPPYLAKTVVSRKKLPVVLNHEDCILMHYNCALIIVIMLLQLFLVHFGIRNYLKIDYTHGINLI